MAITSSAPHTMNQRFTPSASAAGPAIASPTGDAKAESDPKSPMTRPNFSAGTRFCISGMTGALKAAVAANTNPMSAT